MPAPQAAPHLSAAPISVSSHTPPAPQNASPNGPKKRRSRRRVPHEQTDPYSKNRHRLVPTRPRLADNPALTPRYERVRR
jgi:hypothetical protein